MELTKAMLDMLATITDETARNTFKAQLEGNQAVRDHFEGNLRQSDYDRKMNETKAEVERLKGLEKNATDWQKWAAENKPKHERLLADLQAKEKELEDLRAKGANGGGGGNGGDPNAGLTEAQILERINKEIASKGFMSKPELEAALKAAADAREKQFLENTFPSTLAFQSAMNDLQWQHRDEFKTPLDTVAFSKFMVDNKISDPKLAFSQFVSEPRAKNHEAKLRDEIERDLRSKMGLPGTGAAPAPEVGVLQARLQGVKPPVEVPDGTIPGDGRLASMAAQELRSEGKF